MPNPVVERWGSLSATGVAKETTFGTAVAATNFLPMTGNNLELDPGWFSPKLQWGQRDLNVFGLQGQYKNAGTVNGPLFPSNGVPFIAAAIGADGAVGSGVTGSSPSNSTTLSGTITAGATSLTLTSATGYAIGNFIQIDVNAAGTTTSEVRKIQNLVGAVVTLDVATVYGHTTGCTISKVVAPFTHSFTQANTLPSLTVEKNVGSFESLQFTGARVNKLTVACQAANQEATISADMMAKHSQVLATPTAISIVNENPYVFAEATFTLFGQTVNQVISVQVDIENVLKDTYTMNQSHDPQFITPVARHIIGKADVVFTSFDDVTWGYWTQMLNNTTGALSFQLQHPSSAGTWTFTLPKVAIKSYSDAIPMEDIVKTTLNLEALYDFTSSSTISATLVSPNIYVAY